MPSPSTPNVIEYRGNAPAMPVDPYPHEGSPTSHWLTSAIWAVMDQGLFAFSNLVLNVLLFLWMKPEVYGGFAVGFAIFLLMGTFHNSFFIDPMLVFGNDVFRSRLKQYLGVLLSFEVAFGILTCLLLAMAGGICFLLKSSELGSALISMSYAGPFILFLWLMRRTCYMRLQPHLAAIAGTMYFILMLGGLWTINHFGLLSVWTATGVLTASSLISGGWLVLRQGATLPRSISDPVVKEALREHWRFGRWAAAGGLVGYVPAQAPYLILPIFASLETAGLLRALSNLVLPVVQANVAISTLFLSRMVRTRGTPAFGRIVRMGLLLLGGGTIFYWLILGVFHKPICHLVYRGQFDQESVLLWIIGLQPVLTGIFGIYHAVLESYRRPDKVFYASLIPAIATATIGVALTWKFGIYGVACSSVLALGLNLALSWSFTRGLKYSEDTPVGHEGLAHVPVTAEDIER